LGSKFIVSDIPFLANRVGLPEGTKNAGRLINAGASAVKIEGADGNLDLIRHLVDSGIPVMGHLGLTPQSVHQLGGYRVQGRNSEEFQKIKIDSERLQSAGCFALVLECVPEILANEITQSLKIPTIGIGAGNVTDGQVLVLQDLLGMDSSKKMKFVRNFLNLESQVQTAINSFVKETESKTFPNPQETF
jgi:3-methyl-2-oxobutanoate hydroxymethyltransferase